MEFSMCPTRSCLQSMVYWAVWLPPAALATLLQQLPSFHLLVTPRRFKPPVALLRWHLR